MSTYFGSVPQPDDCLNPARTIVEMPAIGIFLRELLFVTADYFNVCSTLVERLSLGFKYRWAERSSKVVQVCACRREETAATAPLGWCHGCYGLK